ncbi:hypothetical protein ACT4MK_19360 [Bradyrhizobium barranii]|uniref:hypothetical protein n=1 Tax=Bradyrhizobium TaxID=374 RepID=UPI003F23F8AE
MRGFELKQRLVELAKRHNVAPIERPAMALLSPVTVPQIVEGIAATPDVDSDRMSFARGSLSWPADLSQLPLLVRHDSNRIAGSLRQMTYDAAGRIHVVAEVTDADARRMAGLSVTAVVIESELRDEDSLAFHAVIRKAIITEISLTPQPANAAAIVTSRRAVTPLDLTHDAAVAAITRLRKHLDAYTAGALQVAPAPAPRPSIGIAPAYIHGRLPAAVLKPRRSEFSRLVASLPTGDGP